MRIVVIRQSLQRKCNHLLVLSADFLKEEPGPDVDTSHWVRRSTRITPQRKRNFEACDAGPPETFKKFLVVEIVRLETLFLRYLKNQNFDGTKQTGACSDTGPCKCQRTSNNSSVSVTTSQVKTNEFESPQIRKQVADHTPVSPFTAENRLKASGNERNYCIPLSSGRGKKILETNVASAVANHSEMSNDASVENLTTTGTRTDKRSLKKKRRSRKTPWLVKPYECQHCRKSFASVTILSTHLRNVHSKIKPYVCDDCGKCFGQPCKLLRHRQTHTGTKPYKCDVCEKFFSCSSNLSTHVKIVHMRIKPFCCQMCGKTFGQLSNLRSHSRTHTGERPYKCNQCDQMFTCHTHRSNHIKRVHEHITHSCKLCGKMFGLPQRLSLHMRSHTGEKPYECAQCGQRFSIRGSLNRHVKVVHEKEKRFACSLCRKQFSYRHHVQYHMRVHTGEKPYQCSICHKRFSEKSNLNYHSRAIHKFV